MKIFVALLSPLVFVAMSVSLRAQTSLSAPDPQLVGTNTSVKLSYAQQIREVQSDETERILSQSMALREQARQRDLKESEEKEDLMRLQQQEMETQQRKQELEDEEVRRELKEQLLIKYVRKLQQESLTNSSAVQQAQSPKDSPTDATAKPDSPAKFRGVLNPAQ